MHDAYETTWLLIVQLCGRNVLVEFKDKQEMFWYQKRLDDLDIGITYIHTSISVPKAPDAQ